MRSHADLFAPAFSLRRSTTIPFGFPPWTCHFSLTAPSVTTRFNERNAYCEWPCRVFSAHFNSVQLPFEPLFHPNLKHFSGNKPLNAPHRFFGKRGCPSRPERYPYNSRIEYPRRTPWLSDS